MRAPSAPRALGLGALFVASAACASMRLDESPTIAPVLQAPDVVLDRGPSIPADRVRADLELVRDAFEALHPGLDRYGGRAALDAGLHALEARLGAELSLAELYVALSELVALVKCGHTSANPWNQPPEVAKLVLEHERVPFAFRWLAGRIVVTEGLTGEASARLPRGTEVLAIDGRSAAEIERTLMRVARADGGNDAKRSAELEVTGRRKFETFDIYFPLYFPWRGPRLVLDVRRPGAMRAERIELARMTAAARRDHLAARASSKDGAPWTLTWLDATTALYVMPTWVTYDRPSWPWRDAIRATFTELRARGAEHLVIDLRGNEGGTEEVGHALLAHLAAAPLSLPPVRREVRYRRVPDALTPYLKTWDPSFRDWGDRVTPSRDGYLRLAGGAPATITPAEPRYEGRTSVLVDGANSSATFQFSQVVQSRGVAMLVGRPTGGNQRGLNSGALFFLHLPGSGIELDLPLIGYFPESIGDLPDAGLTPDVLIAPSLDDVAAGRDADLDAARAAGGRRR